MPPASYLNEEDFGLGEDTAAGGDIFVNKRFGVGPQFGYLVVGRIRVVDMYEDNAQDTKLGTVVKSSTDILEKATAADDDTLVNKQCGVVPHFDYFVADKIRVTGKKNDKERDTWEFDVGGTELEFDETAVLFLWKDTYFVANSVLA
mmetsp:Transcript_1193/g.4912  ORF Transcript_1193/g.4912 Transcript_1193/m.4912 type:complete len:147 (+) Transcript_1193:631-1071(+)